MSPVVTVKLFSDGERVPMLLDAAGLPLFYPTLYVTAQLRNAGLAVNTIRNRLADLLVLLRWEATFSRDLLSEFKQGQFLDLADVVALRDFAMLDMREVQGKTPAASNSRRRSLLEAHTASVAPSASVGAQQHYNRLSTIAEYLEFVASVITQHNDSPADSASIERMAKAIRQHRPRGLANRFSDDPHDKSPPSELVDRFMAVTAIDHPDNPFADKSMRARNAILFGVLRYTGMRRGELLALRVDDFELGSEPLVWVRRRQDDPHDKRRYQPVAKTKERALPLPRPLADQIQHYVVSVRAAIPPARKHPYLLVSHRKGKSYGQPLSQSALGSQIMERMRTVDPDFSLIHPHSFRHHFNYELSVRIDEQNKKARKHSSDDDFQPISEAQEQDVRAFLNGHRGKASGAAYNRRHIREMADQAIRQVQSGMTDTKIADSDND